ncbi:MAG: hypothetical protein LIO93_10635, partial [Bacteroidales bacterium]|nr:hypothetical protein [Bacteroidales bacterium]
RISGSKNIPSIECINPIKNKWKIRWDFREEDEVNASYMEHDFDHKPETSEIKEVIISWHNREISNRILSGFVWKEIPVWLSTENQMNFKRTFDLAFQTDGSTLPVTFKLGTDEEPVYHTFETLDELTDFYIQSAEYIQKVLEEGWQAKQITVTSEQ